MEKATRVLNLMTMVILLVIGIYLHITFARLLNNYSLLLLWVIIAVLIGLQFENAFNIVRRKFLNP